jgi:hypothetical protein
MRSVKALDSEGYDTGMRIMPSARVVGPPQGSDVKYEPCASWSSIPNPQTSCSPVSAIPLLSFVRSCKEREHENAHTVHRLLWRTVSTPMTLTLRILPHPPTSPLLPDIALNRRNMLHRSISYVQCHARTQQSFERVGTLTGVLDETVRQDNGPAHWLCVLLLNMLRACLASSSCLFMSCAKP